MNQKDVYVIWSFEHEAWWRPGRSGYTATLEEAGHYSHTESQCIVADANRRLRLRYPNEQAVLLSVAMESGRPKGLHRVAPGVYDDGEGGMHVDVAELLYSHGYDDTPANREVLINAVRDAVGTMTPVHIMD